MDETTNVREANRPLRDYLQQPSKSLDGILENLYVEHMNFLVNSVEATISTVYDKDSFDK